jgi:hypothetical protein
MRFQPGLASALTPGTATITATAFARVFDDMSRGDKYLVDFRWLGCPPPELEASGT